MFIKEIELNNFRIYKGKNIISLLHTDDKNVTVISGKNGFGKTTFLMSLVWCLYGRQMDRVDELYEKEIRDKGNYTKYISESLNRKAREEGEKEFSVSVTFSGNQTFWVISFGPFLTKFTYNAKGHTHFQMMSKTEIYHKF